jgi:hypothetical protein
MPDTPEHFDTVGCSNWETGRTLTVNGVAVDCSSTTMKAAYPVEPDGYVYFEVGQGSVNYASIFAFVG